ncbi:GntR family transcriptional regulator [Tepidibacter formicigenes]|uniref:Transcriptional regulator, GntR family n=1 Tax=Tepidibacter formicigenes DSM 15518 TaxID=1123349 RepID=A0A1M6KQC8_9FIRM|nr:GntR family transcriptional regulator [Tepidibacter formicigenes]SHJ61094.1 transcriptional regulator, GntR family [Tepidibacter formicigenes DSM 15518]
MIDIDSRSSKPIYEQIVDQIKENIMKGILMHGDKLPSVRELSSMITVNPNTISRAYQELERQRFLISIKGRGTYVSDDYKPKIDNEKLESLKKQVKNMIIEFHYMGMKKGDILDLIQDLYNELKKE